MEEKIYSFLKSQNYSFKLRKNSVIFKKYNDAFNATFDLSNMFIDMTVAQSNKTVYFSEKKTDLPYLEAKDNEEDVTYEGLIMSFSMYLGWILNIHSNIKIGKNKALIEGDPDLLYQAFITKYSESFSLVVLKKNRRGLLVKRSRFKF